MSIKSKNKSLSLEEMTRRQEDWEIARLGRLGDKKTGRLGRRDDKKTGRICEWEMRRLGDKKTGRLGRLVDKKTGRLRDWKKKDELFDLFINFKLFNFLPLLITHHPSLLNS